MLATLIEAPSHPSAPSSIKVPIRIKLLFGFPQPQYKQDPSSVFASGLKLSAKFPGNGDQSCNPSSVHPSISYASQPTGSQSLSAHHCSGLKQA